MGRKTGVVGKLRRSTRHGGHVSSQANDVTASQVIPSKKEKEI